MPRGILATVSASVHDGVTADDLRACYAKAYADEPFVHLLPEGLWPVTKSVTGSNSVHLQVTLDAAAGRMVAVGAVDNLAKGTGGAAVQCMNLALGLPEQTGLSTVGLAP
jgi:N-acetyl-gamma-glutamyl-phosphate reductase